MKIFTVAIFYGILQGDIVESFCSVYAGKTEEEAVHKAVVEHMWDWWHDECVMEEKDPDSATDQEIFDAYCDCYSEEHVEVQEHEI